MGGFVRGDLCTVLRVGHFLKPIDGFAVEGFLDGNVGHGGGGGGAVPVFFAGREADDITGMPSLLLFGSILMVADQASKWNVTPPIGNDRSETA